MLVGAKHPVEHRHAVVAAAHRHQHVWVAVHRRFRGFQMRHRTPQIAGVDHLCAHRCRTCHALQRIREIGESVDPDVVVEVLEGRQNLFALPLAQEQARLVHDVAEPQDERGAARLEHLQRLHHLALESQRLLVHEKEIGTEALRRLVDDRRANRHRLVEIDVQSERLVFAVVQLDDTGNAHEIDARQEIEAADDRRARKNQDRDPLVSVDDRVGDRPAAAQVPEAEAVVAVNQYPCVVESFHP